MERTTQRIGEEWSGGDIRFLVCFSRFRQLFRAELAGGIYRGGVRDPTWPIIITSAIIKDLAISVVLQSQRAVARMVQLCAEIVSVGC
jgi:hypothetical protein